MEPAEGKSSELRPPTPLRHLRNPRAWNPCRVRAHPSSHLCPQGTAVAEPNPWRWQEPDEQRWQEPDDWLGSAP